MRDQTTHPQKPKQDQRLKINPDPSTWSMADHDRVIRHVVRHMPDTIEFMYAGDGGLCGLFDPQWPVELAMSMLPLWSDVISGVERDDLDNGTVAHWINYTDAVRYVGGAPPPVNDHTIHAERIIAPPEPEPKPEPEPEWAPDEINAELGADGGLLAASDDMQRGWRWRRRNINCDASGCSRASPATGFMSRPRRRSSWPTTRRSTTIATNSNMVDFRT
jgi:hypothetical protein